MFDIYCIEGRKGINAGNLECNRRLGETATYLTFKGKTRKPE